MKFKKNLGFYFRLAKGRVRHNFEFRILKLPFKSVTRYFAINTVES